MKSQKINTSNLHKKALFYEYLTIAWNVLEGIICVALGVFTNSIALVGYGLESSIEVFASVVVVWELKNSGKSKTNQALKLIGGAYFLVSAYIIYDALKSLFGHIHPEKTVMGIFFLILTVIVMLTLGFKKRNIGRKMKSKTVLADAKFTLIDASLASTVLIGLIFNAVFGWWWFDQVMALFLAGIAFSEGIKEFKN